MIFQVETAQQAFLAFLHQRTHQQKQNSRAKNLIQEMLFIQLFSHLETTQEEDPLGDFDDFGQNSTSFHNFSAFADKIRDDPSLSVAFLERLESLEHYLMVVSVICDLNDFMKSEWHALWQQIEMQSSDPPPHLFPSVCGEISEKFTSYESELQNLLRTLNGASVLDLLVGCLKSLPFPLVTMEMTTERQWFPITTVNTAFEVFSGFTEHQVKGLAFKSLNANLNLELISVIRSEMLTGQVSRAIFPFCRTSGVMAACVIGVIPIVDVNHAISSFLVLFDDISSPDYCLTRLKIFSDLLDSISSDLNLSLNHGHRPTLSEGHLI
jgi:hypothetical protein